jgi:undecaprenyl-diphosphatase
VRPATPARVREGRQAPALADGEGLVVAVNPNSGTDDYDPVAEIARLLPRAEVLQTSPERGIDALLGEAAASGRARALGVAGGDGSVASAAAVALEHGLPLAVLPAGTLNHFARDVGVETVEAGAGAVVRGEAVEVDVAEVNGTPFLNTASIGVYPEMVSRRDELSGRLGKWIALVVATAQVLHGSRPVRAELDGRPATFWVLFIGNCCYTPRGLSPAWRPSLEDGLLDVQYLRADIRFSRTRAVLTTLLGISERTSSYAQTQARELTVVSRDGEHRAAYDGETGEPATEWRFGKRERLTVYCCRS